MRGSVLFWPLGLLVRLVLKVLTSLCRLVGDEDLCPVLATGVVDKAGA